MIGLLIARMTADTPQIADRSARELDRVVPVQHRGDVASQQFAQELAFRFQEGKVGRATAPRRIVREAT
jgi:hypothetical protein